VFTVGNKKSGVSSFNAPAMAPNLPVLTSFKARSHDISIYSISNSGANASFNTSIKKPGLSDLALQVKGHQGSAATLIVSAWAKLKLINTIQNKIILNIMVKQ
jgi:hypothetical protein